MYGKIRLARKGFEFRITGQQSGIVDYGHGCGKGVGIRDRIIGF